MKWKVPVAVHHRLLPGLSQPASSEDKTLGKMSKSNPSSGIFVHDSDDEIRTKIKKSWCEEANIENNPLLEISKHVIFHELDQINVERPEKFGGNVSYANYEELESDFGQKKLHPTDLKQTVAENLIKIISPIREKIKMTDELVSTIKKSY